MAEAGAACSMESFTAGDGYCWKYRRYLPDGVPKAHVVCIHGIQSHGGWYTYSCERLRQAGYAVSFLDRRGSGLNEVARGDAPGFRRLLDDIAEFVRALVEGSRLDENSLPVFLVAISWGGKLGLALQRRHPGLIDGLVLICPGIFPKVRPTLRERLGIAKARLLSPRKLFPIPLNDPALFTASPKWLQFIADDPLGLKQATARLLVESVRLDGYVRLSRQAVSVSMLLLLAEQDRIIDNVRIRQLVEQLPSTDKRVIEYAGAHHTLEFEPDPDVFVTDLRQWLDERCAVALANRKSDR